MKPRPVVVTWLDAHETSGEFKVADVLAQHAPKVLHTVGYLIARDAAGVSIGTEVSDDGTEYRTVNFIPAGMVVKVRRLR